jgi:hypothetical protein
MINGINNNYNKMKYISFAVMALVNAAPTMPVAPKSLAQSSTQFDFSDPEILEYSHNMQERFPGPANVKAKEFIEGLPALEYPPDKPEPQKQFICESNQKEPADPR